MINETEITFIENFQVGVDHIPGICNITLDINLEPTQEYTSYNFKKLLKQKYMNQFQKFLNENISE